MPGVLARSSTDAVGTPPLQKKASILPSFSASTDWATPRLTGVRSRPGSRPAARSTRVAISSVPLPAAPIDTCLPARSAIRATPLDPLATRCV